MGKEGTWESENPAVNSTMLPNCISLGKEPRRQSPGLDL